MSFTVEELYRGLLNGNRNDHFSKLESEWNLYDFLCNMCVQLGSVAHPFAARENDPDVPQALQRLNNLLYALLHEENRQRSERQMFADHAQRLSDVAREVQRLAADPDLRLSDRQGAALATFAQGIQARAAAGVDDPNAVAAANTPVLRAEFAPSRLALLRRVQARLEATGTGRTWYGARRSANSPAYDALCREVARQIRRLEAGQPTTQLDRELMLSALDGYTRGRESGRGTGYGRDRQECALLLYREYTVAKTLRPDGGVEENVDDFRPVAERFNAARWFSRRIDPERDCVIGEVETSCAKLFARAQENANTLLQGLTEPPTDTAWADFERAYLRAAALRRLAVVTRLGGNRSIPSAEQIEQEANRLFAPAGAYREALALAKSSPELRGELMDAMFTNVNLDALSAQHFSNTPDPITEQLGMIRNVRVRERQRILMQELGAAARGERTDETRRAAVMQGVLRLVELRRMAAGGQGADARLTDEALDDAVRANATAALSAAAAGCADDPERAAEALALFERSLSLPQLTNAIERLQYDTTRAQRERGTQRLDELLDGAWGEEAPAAAEQALLTVAALNNLAARNGTSFRPSPAEVQDEMQRLRENGLFITPLRDHLRSSNDVRAFLRGMAAQRAEAELDYLRRTENPDPGLTAEQRDAVASRRRAALARLIVLRRRQAETGNVNVFLNDRGLEESANRVMLTEGFRALTRTIDAGGHSVQSVTRELLAQPNSRFNTVYNQFVEPLREQYPWREIEDSAETLYKRRLRELNTADLTGNELERTLAEMLAMRRLTLERDTGAQTKVDGDMLAILTQQTRETPVYVAIVARLRREPGFAPQVRQLLRNAERPAQLQERQASDRNIRDPLTEALAEISVPTVRERFDLLAEQARSMAAGWNAQQLTEAQRQELRALAVQLMTLRACLADEDGGEQRITDERLREKGAEIAATQLAAAVLDRCGDKMSTGRAMVNVLTDAGTLQNNSAYTAALTDLAERELVTHEEKLNELTRSFAAKKSEFGKLLTEEQRAWLHDAAVRGMALRTVIERSPMDLYSADAVEREMERIRRAPDMESALEKAYTGETAETLLDLVDSGWEIAETNRRLSRFAEAPASLWADLAMRRLQNALPEEKSSWAEGEKEQMLQAFAMMASMSERTYSEGWDEEMKLSAAREQAGRYLASRRDELEAMFTTPEGARQAVRSCLVVRLTENFTQVDALNEQMRRELKKAAPDREILQQIKAQKTEAYARLIALRLLETERDARDRKKGVTGNVTDQELEKKVGEIKSTERKTLLRGGLSEEETLNDHFKKIAALVEYSSGLNEEEFLLRMLRGKHRSFADVIPEIGQKAFLVAYDTRMGALQQQISELNGKLEQEGTTLSDDARRQLVERKLALYVDAVALRREKRTGTFVSEKVHKATCEGVRIGREYAQIRQLVEVSRGNADEAELLAALTMERRVSGDEREAQREIDASYREAADAAEAKARQIRQERSADLPPVAPIVNGRQPEGNGPQNEINTNRRRSDAPAL